jgi:SNF2 family DNA or RNA helicase
VNVYARPAKLKAPRAVKHVEAGNVAAALVVCPTSVIAQWTDQIEQHLDPTIEPIIYAPVGQTIKARAAAIEHLATAPTTPKTLRIVIVNYEALVRMHGAITNFVNGEGCALIADEAHRLKNGLAKVTRFVAELQPQYLWLMTGTPVANKPEDIFSLMDLVQPCCLGAHFMDFSREYLIRHRYTQAIIGYKNIPKLRAKLRTISLARTKADHLNLPPFTIANVPVLLADEEIHWYRDRVKAFHDEIHGTMDGDATKMPLAKILQQPRFALRWTRLRQATDGYFVQDLEDSVKRSWSKDLSKLNTAYSIWKDQGSPRAIFWFGYVDVLKRFTELVKDETCFAIHGDVVDRGAILEKWTATPGAILAMQMNVGALGLNLQAGSWQCFIDLPTTPAQLNQAISRMHRFGQERATTRKKRTPKTISFTSREREERRKDQSQHPGTPQATRDPRRLARL